MLSRFLVASTVLAGTAVASAVPRDDLGLTKSWISLPITHAVENRDLVRRDTDVPLYNVSIVSYLVELSIGSPGQTVKVAIDTGSDELWVDPQCTGGDLQSSERSDCIADGQYTPSSSKTSTQLSSGTTIEYGKGEVRLTYYTDNITLPDSSISVSQAQFGVATTTSELSEGILGLGWGSNLAYHNFVDVLALQNVTRTKAFSVVLGSAGSNNGGVLIFGGVDTKKFSGNLVSNPILGPQNGENINRYWIQMTAVSLTTSTGTTAYSGGNIPIVIDSGSSLSYLPETVTDKLAQDLGGEYSQDDGFYFVNCSVATTTTTVDFAFGSATIRIPLSDFVLPAGSGYCILGAVPVSSTTAVTPLLGDTFMRSAVVVFDQTSKTISLAQYANCGESEQDISTSGVNGLAGQCAAGQISSSGSSSSSKNSATSSKPPSALIFFAALAIFLLHI